MTLRRNTASGQSDGTLLVNGTPGSGSGGGGNDAFDSIAVASSGVGTTKSTVPIEGPNSYLVDCSANNLSNVLGKWNMSTSALAFHMWLYWPVLPAGAVTVAQCRAAGQVVGVGTTTTNNLQVLASGTGFSSIPLVAATLYRLEVCVLVGTTTVNGTLKADLYDAAGTSLGTYSSAVRNTGIVPLTLFQVGKSSTTAAVFPTFYMGGIALDDAQGITEIGVLAPLTTTARPVPPSILNQIALSRAANW